MNAFAEDWRKYAAAATQDNADIEKAFFDQTFMVLQNKCQPLMRSPYRVGFEIVYKNDENTRMVGIFVFRLKTSYIFAPVFFVNGSIKGTDLLYRADLKRFVPLNNEWCTYLIQTVTSEEGKGVSQRERQFTRDQMNLIDLVEPPEVFRFNRKYASVCDSQEELDGLKTLVEEVLQKSAAIPEPEKESILKKFITKDGGFSAIKKLANTARHDFEFAQALMLGSQPDNYAPRLEPHPVKQASADHLLIVRSSVLRNKHIKKASAKEMSQGYQIEDLRKEAMANDVVYTDNTVELSQVQAPGVYNVLLADGTNRKMLVGYYMSMNVANGPEPVALKSSYDPGYYDQRRREIVLIDTESKASKTIYPSDQQWPFGEYIGKIDDSGMLQDLSEAETGNAYRIYDTEAQSFSEPFYVKAKDKDPSGLTALQCATWSTTDTPSRPLLINPDFRDYDPKDNIHGTRCKLVKVAFKLTDGYSKMDTGKRIQYDDQLGIGGKHTLNAFIFENNFKKASVQSLPNNRYLVKTARREKWSQELSPISAKIQLMVDCALREDAAEEVLKEADVKAGKKYDDNMILAEVARERSSKNWIKPVIVKRQDVGLEEWEEAKKRLHTKQAASNPRYDFFYDGTKLAHNLRFNDWPDFYERTNDEFGVLEQPWTSYILDAESDRPIIEHHRVGDKWTQDDSSAIDTMNPMQLYELSQNKGMGNLFEHGVVGELVKTYDSAGLIQTYIPDMEKALDRLGRILFLFYWKPEDFSQAYGSDDQSSLENKLLSNFKSMGELVLELLQKAKLQQEGTVSLT